MAMRAEMSPEREGASNTNVDHLFRRLKTFLVTYRRFPIDGGSTRRSLSAKGDRKANDADLVKEAPIWRSRRRRHCKEPKS